MSCDTTEDELLELHEDARNSDVDETTCDSFEVDDPATLQNGGRITSRPKASALASSQEISPLTSAIQMLTDKLPSVLDSPLVEAQKNERSKGKRSANSLAAGVPAKKSRVGDSEANSSTSASVDSDCQSLYDSVLHSQDDDPGLQTTSSGDEGQEDTLISELVKEYESDDTVGDNLKSEQ